MTDGTPLTLYEHYSEDLLVDCPCAIVSHLERVGTEQETLVL